MEKQENILNKEDLLSLSKEDLIKLFLAEKDSREQEKEAARFEKEETKREINKLNKTVADMASRIAELEEFRRLRHSERYVESSDQLLLFVQEVEALVIEDEPLKPEELIKIKEHTKKKPRKQTCQASSLAPCYDIYHYDENTACKYTDADGITYVRSGEDYIVEKAAFIPSKIVIEKHHHIKYVAKDVDVKSLVPTLITKLDKTGLSASFVSNVIVQKYDDHIPLFRQEEIFRRMGYYFSRQRMARSIIDYSDVLRPLASIFKDEIYKSKYLNKDETPVQVLDLKAENGKPSTNNFMYITIGSTYIEDERTTHALVLMDYIQDRKKDTLLEDYKRYNYSGHIMTDGLKQYLEFDNHSVCWVHAIRALKKIIKVDKKAEAAIYICKEAAKLYQVEDITRSKLLSGIYDSATFLAKRKEQCLKIVNDLFVYAKKQVPLYSPTGAMGKALSYLFTYREYLTTYLDIIEATPDNNAAERIAKPFAVGRKNWLFSQTIDGADATAFFFSLIETAKLQNISPSDYVEYVLTFGPSLKTKEEFKSLLPWNVDFTRLEKIRSKRFNATPDKTRTKPYIFAGSNR